MLVPKVAGRQPRRGGRFVGDGIGTAGGQHFCLPICINVEDQGIFDVRGGLAGNIPKNGARCPVVHRDLQFVPVGDLEGAIATEIKYTGPGDAGGQVLGGLLGALILIRVKAASTNE